MSNSFSLCHKYCMRHIYTKNGFLFVVYRKFKFDCISCTLSGNPSLEAKEKGSWWSLHWLWNLPLDHNMYYSQLHFSGCRSQITKPNVNDLEKNYYSKRKSTSQEAKNTLNGILTCHTFVTKGFFSHKF